MRDAVILRNRSKRLGLSASTRYWDMPGEKLNVMYNGYGPDKWPECLRAITTWLYRNFEATASIHDERYDGSDGTYAGWLEADDEFADNFKTEIESRYPFWSAWLWPLRVIALGKRTTAMEALELGGFTAWQNAWRRRCNDDVRTHLRSTL
jgi:hypothetical protein